MELPRDRERRAADQKTARDGAHRHPDPEQDAENRRDHERNRIHRHRRGLQNGFSEERSRPPEVPARARALPRHSEKLPLERGRSEAGQRAIPKAKRSSERPVAQFSDAPRIRPAFDVRRFRALRDKRSRREDPRERGVPHQRADHAGDRGREHAQPEDPDPFPVRRDARDQPAFPRDPGVDRGGDRDGAEGRACYGPLLASLRAFHRDPGAT